MLTPDVVAAFNHGAAGNGRSARFDRPVVIRQAALTRVLRTTDWAKVLMTAPNLRVWRGRMPGQLASKTCTTSRLACPT
jgi:hypothetical protein